MEVKSFSALCNGRAPLITALIQSVATCREEGDVEYPEKTEKRAKVGLLLVVVISGVQGVWSISSTACRDGKNWSVSQQSR